MTPARNDLPILVAGGGIGGLAAALALGRNGHVVHVLEQSDGFGEVGAGIQIAPNAFRMFKALGVTEAINDVAVLPDHLVMMDALDGSEVTRVPLNDDLFGEHFEFPYAVIYRPDLHQVLMDACRALPDVKLSTGVEVTGHEDLGTHIRISTASGDAIDGAALIGADGLWSGVRKQIVDDGPPRVSGHIAYRAVLPTPEVPEANKINDVVLWAGPKTHLVHYPLHRGDIFNLVAVFHSDRYEEGWDVFGDVAELQERFAGQHHGVLGMLDKIESWRMWVLCDREPVRNWSRGRVTLLGDAAHPMLQYLAQGACLAMEDAVCLAVSLERCDDFASAFADYQAKRYLRTARVQLTARLYGDIYHAADATADLRKLMLGGRAPAQAYQGMKWLYDGVDENGSRE
ncbi:MAG: 3-hydroxybenzoate 6-monooxygenase [Hyphomicrobiales bacterium]|nr:3-hydroxybenzoate 6-monooxygenase [Hyphomicrobiales bacterium]